MTFSDRTSWQRRPNGLTELLDRRRAANEPVYDCTCSNPTECSFTYADRKILGALSTPRSLRYNPDPSGLLTARRSIVRRYRMQKLEIDPSRLFLVASTSEAYSMVLKILCNPGDEILVPRPSYPLFEYLAQVNDVRLRHYRLEYHDGWDVDLDSIRNGITGNTKAIVLVHPHNPTGYILSKDNYLKIQEIAREHEIALIVDEVFLDYRFADNKDRMGSTAGDSDVLTFTLDGISKLAGLPQLKLGWIVVNGPRKIAVEACGRLEILCDTFLSVNTPVQTALPVILENSRKTQLDILNRTRTNYNALTALIDADSPCSVLRCEGGWYGIIRLPAVIPGDRWAEVLLNTSGIYVFPGYFFDFEQEGYIVVSLLVKERAFKNAMRKLLGVVGERISSLPDHHS